MAEYVNTFPVLDQNYPGGIFQQLIDYIAANTTVAKPTLWEGCDASQQTLAYAKQLSPFLPPTLSQDFPGGTAQQIVAYILGLDMPNKFDPANLGAGNILLPGNNVQSLGLFNDGRRSEARTLASKSSGKFYVEVIIVKVAGWFQAVGLGIMNSNSSVNTPAGLGTDAFYSLGFYGNGVVYINNASVYTGDTFAEGDVVGMAIDVGAQLIWFRTITGGIATQNWNNSSTANPATGVGGFSTSSVALPYFIGVGLPDAKINDNGALITPRVSVNFGAATWSALPPINFNQWQ